MPELPEVEAWRRALDGRGTSATLPPREPRPVDRERRIPMTEESSARPHEAVKAVVFDLDDTLYDCLNQCVGPAHREAARAMVEAGAHATVEEVLEARLALAGLYVLDLDDATYVSYTSPTYGGAGSALKWFGKTDDLIKWAAVVTCGNRSIAEYVESKGARARIIPCKP